MRILALTATIALCATAMLASAFETRPAFAQGVCGPRCTERCASKGRGMPICMDRCLPNCRAKVAAKQSNKQWKKAGN